MPATSPLSKLMFSKVLIANRGEIACRIIATCRRLGIATVAVYSDADANARHVRLADEAVHIGPAPAAESYLRGEAIIAAAHACGAQAIHPGYGFLSENAGFARDCAQAGITFIGPPAEAIEAMGSKSAAKALMGAAGVPLTPGYHGDSQDAALLQQQADAIGYPVLIKASAGGGGKGMRRVDSAADFAAALTSCRREAANAFGNDQVLVEKYVLNPRHIEIQVFADGHGNVVHLFERDCSVQRRHQKVLEEAPAPGMTEQRRAAMGAAAVDAARAVGYVGAGTVEFIAAPDGAFYFMEMNTRLQVEHPVTELITGLDLVEWQLRVAAGQPLPLAQQQLQINGHAIEARLYAEDADHGFLPSTGTLHHLRLPPASAHVRVDSGVEQGDVISPYYDPMIAKLVVWDVDRDAALRRMDAALAACRVVGVTTNAGFLRRLVTTDSFANARLDTALIEREQAALEIGHTPLPATLWALAATLAQQHQQRPANAPAGWSSPWQAGDGWRLHGRGQWPVTLRHGSEQQHWRVAGGNGHWQLQGPDTPSIALLGRIDANGHFALQLDGRQWQGQAVWQGQQLHLFCAQGHYRFSRLDPLATQAGSGHGGDLTAPMPGRIVSLLAEPGSTVSAGQPLLVMEAMKMEHTIHAPQDGTLAGYRVVVDQQVAEGSLLVDFSAGSALASNDA
ncbi:MAG: acetyl/propionyl/methylcrotonyl-CoA carboxylase subunit alpha [Stenotrophomonas sp.]